MTQISHVNISIITVTSVLAAVRDGHESEVPGRIVASQVCGAPQEGIVSAAACHNVVALSALQDIGGKAGFEGHEWFLKD